MLLYSEIAQLSDRDLLDEIENARNSLFRQKMGVRTKHLKDTHIVKALRKYIAQMLTELRRRKQLGEKVEKTSSEVTKKTEEMHSMIEKAQTSKKKKAEKKVEKAEQVAEKVEAKSSKDVKVKKVEKKGFFSRKKKTEEKES
ncbi:50S ribosomal protein L29 [Candidatus Gracilibacteria bacterium]|nr:50S ribosomal protein L29 [Candidatus Gracilibacteria bacterium]